MLVAEVRTYTVNVDMNVVTVAASHPLHVLSHPPGATRVEHNSFLNIP